MALKNLKQNAPAAQFENPDEDGDVAVMERPEVAAPAAAPAAAAAAVAVRQNTAVAPRPVQPAITDDLGLLKDRFEPVDFGTAPVLSGSNGSVMDNDKKILGESVTVRVMSWNEVTKIVPNDMAPAAKQYFRTSLDGVYTSQGENVDEYLRELQTTYGYKKATKKVYIECFGILEKSAKDSPHVGKSVVLSLAPDSVKSFKGYQRDRSIKNIMTGVEVEYPNAGVLIKATANVKSHGSNTWTQLAISDAE